MLILVAVTINTAVNSGLFGHAKDATTKWADKQREESEIGNDNYITDSVNEYTGNKKYDRTGLKIGDYVDYTPEPAENYMGLGVSSNAHENPSGSNKNPIEGIQQDKSLKWRIMSINEDGSVDLISEKATNEKIYLHYALGCNNGVFLLNDLCSNLYSNSTLGVTARSINLLDIESRLNSRGIAVRDAYHDEYKSYGETRIYSDYQVKTPDIYKHVGKTLEEETKSYYTSPTTETYTLENNLEVTETFYVLYINADYFDLPIFVDLLVSGDNSYWLASRLAYHLNPPSFGIRRIDLGWSYGRPYRHNIRGLYYVRRLGLERKYRLWWFFCSSTGSFRC